MTKFEIAHSITMGHEGGYANDPVDTGGETIFGVTRRDHPNSPIWKLVDTYKSKYGLAIAIPMLNKDNTIKDLAKAIYKTGYWDINKLDQINNQEICNEMFDTAVNMGVGTAARFLQKALNYTNKNQQAFPDLKVDGAIGSITLDRVNKHPNPSLLYAILNVQQGARYLEIMDKAPAQERFALSWFSRVNIKRI